MILINATALDRKSGERSGEICGPFLEMFFDRGVMGQWGPPKVMKNGSRSATTLPGSTALPFVISTVAHPDFLLRAAGNDHVCGSP